MRRLDDVIPSNHPLREIRKMANVALAKMEPLFAQMYEADSKGGRPSVAPEKLLRAMLLQVLYSVRSERQLMEQVQYNMLYRWFIGLAMDDSVWVPTVFTKNRERHVCKHQDGVSSRRYPTFGKLSTHVADSARSHDLGKRYWELYKTSEAGARTVSRNRRTVSYESYCVINLCLTMIYYEIWRKRRLFYL
jgi:hypothetical protein